MQSLRQVLSILGRCIVEEVVIYKYLVLCKDTGDIYTDESKFTIEVYTKKYEDIKILAVLSSTTYHYDRI